MQNKIIQKINKLGLTDKEARVYVACLMLGESSIVTITKAAKLPKTTTYDILQNLAEKGLVSRYNRKKRYIFSVTSPQVFKEKILEQSSLLDSLLPDLYSLYRTAHRPTCVRFFEGEEGIKIISQEILTEAAELLAICSAEDVFIRPPEFFEKFIPKRIQKKIPLRVIYNDSPKARERKRNDIHELKTSKIIIPTLPFQSLIFLWKNKICFITLKKEYCVSVVEDHDGAQIFKSMFEMIWKYVPEK